MDSFPSSTSVRSGSPAQYPESRVLIIMTGGTICMRHGPEGLVPSSGFMEEAMMPRPSFNDGSRPAPLPVTINTQTTHLPSLRTPPSTYSRHIRYTLYEFPVLLDSSSISSSGWTQIAQTIQSNYALYSGFVVLHGTDSLAYTASALSFMLANLGKPVIMTGAQKSIFALQSDAVDNLLGALIVAGTFMVPEVGVFFGGKLFRGNRTTKSSSTSFAAFTSPNHPPLATVTSTGLTLSWPLILRPTTLSPLTVHPALNTGHVACLRIFPGLLPAMLDSILHLPGLRGLILETFGAGNAPAGPDNALITIIRNAVQRGIHVINISQCASGTVSPLYAPATALSNAGVTFGHDLTSEAALTKLSYLLALEGLSYEEIKKRMGTSLVGEMTGISETEFEHPDGVRGYVVTEEQSAFAALGYAIAEGDAAKVVGMVGGRRGLVGARDYAGNTALHLGAVGRSGEIVSALLQRGSSVHVVNKAGNTPLGLASQCGNTAIAEILRGAGALLHVVEAERGVEAENRGV